MKNLPNEWVVNIKKNENNKLIDKFKKWFNTNTSKQHSFVFNYYGQRSGIGMYFDFLWKENEITLEEWHECVFEKQFKEGELVLVKDKNHDEWFSVIFVCEYNGLYIADWDGDVDSWEECKNKPSELDEKIKELNDLAQEKGIKLTITFE